MKKVITVKEKIIGGGNAQICVPIVGENQEQLSEELETVIQIKPDIVEWRADFLENTEEENVLAILNKIHDTIPEYPLIFTLRIDSEGGNKKVPQELRRSIIKNVIRTRKADIVDIELINEKEFSDDIMSTAKEYGVYVIISNHDFKNTPEEEEIINTLREAQDLGADIAKIAVMPNSISDVLILLNATNKFNQEFAKVPVITMSMSGKGVISRIGADIFGSSVTFGIGKKASAPGQISVAELREVLNILNKHS